MRSSLAKRLGTAVWAKQRPTPESIWRSTRLTASKSGMKAALLYSSTQGRCAMPKGPKGEKRPDDAIGLAVMIGQIATGEFNEPPR